jgi:hypothetical protein
MRKCAICGHEVETKKQMVTVKIGKWFKRKTLHFHIDCFVKDKIKARDLTVEKMKS